MATVFLLRHPDASTRFPPVRLTRTGATLVTLIDGTESIQNLPSREAAEAHLERFLRLRRDEGYRILERGETADDVEPIDDPIAHLVKFRKAGRRAQVDFEEGPISPEQAAEVVARIVARAPASIDYFRADEVPGGLFGAALAGKALPSVKALVFGTNTPVRDYRLPLDDLADLFAVLPNLERVDATDWFTLREAGHQALSELRVDSLRLPPGIIAALGRGSLPALTTLHLLLGDRHGLDRAAAAALRSVAAPRLSTVRVTGIEDVARFLAELTLRPLPASWSTLYVEGSVAEEDELLALLQQRAATLRSVAVLGLPLADELSEGGVAEAKALLPRVADVGELPDLWPQGASETW